MGGHFNKVFNRKVISVLTKAGFDCKPTRDKNKFWISKNGGYKYLVHSGPLDKLHNLRRFLNTYYKFVLKL